MRVFRKWAWISRGLATGLAMLAAGPAAGQENAVPPAAAPVWIAPPKQAPAAPTTAPERKPTIIMDRAVCRALPRHVPAPDVAYRPGVDVQGDRVAPADLAGGADLLPDRIEIGITVPLASRFGIPEEALYAAEAYLGTVTVADGRVLFNNRPIGDAAAAELVAVCARQGGN